MKKEDLTKLGLTDDAVIDAIMTAHSKDLEKFKTASETAKAEVETFKTQLTEANKQIEGFKGMDVDSIKKTADDYKTKFEQAEKDFASQLTAKDFERDLEGALVGAKAKNVKAVKPLLSIDELKDANGKFIKERFDEQLGKVKPENDYLFESDAPPPPKIVTGGNSKSVGEIPGLAAWKAAGFPDGPPKK